MKRSCLAPHATAIGCALAAAVLAGLSFTGVPARADIDVRIDIGNAPPAPHFVFQVRPHERYLPGQRIYVVDDPRAGDYDCFRYGGYYWVFREGYWYRSASWRRGFRVVNPRYVPAVFYRVPPAHWKHRPSGPPGLAKKSGGGPPGLQKGSNAGPPGQMDRGGKGNDKQGGRGRK
jgi:hypothetical protein